MNTPRNAIAVQTTGKAASECCTLARRPAIDARMTKRIGLPVAASNMSFVTAHALRIVVGAFALSTVVNKNGFTIVHTHKPEARS